MLNFIKNFRNDENGAVTVDWVVLTAAVVALGLAVGSTILNDTSAQAAKIVNTMGTSVDTGLAQK